MLLSVLPSLCVRRALCAAVGRAAQRALHKINVQRAPASARHNGLNAMKRVCVFVSRRDLSTSTCNVGPAPLSKPKSLSAEAEAAANSLVMAAVEAQRAFCSPQYSQSAVDRVFQSVALDATVHRLDLAKLAVEDTNMGVVEDKVVKNHFAAEFPFNKYRDVRTVGLIEQDVSGGFERVAEPVGPIFAIIPVTNPTSTVIFKSLLAIKTRNAVVFCPHPRAALCTQRAVDLLNKAAVRAGAPANLLQCVSAPSSLLSDYLIHHPSIRFLLATGGGGMVRACYSSGKPAIGVGAGNCPALIDETADIQMAVSSIIMSKTFDNGVICASEQTVVVVKSVYDAVLKEFLKRGAYVVQGAERDALRQLCFSADPEHINGDVIGQPATKIAAMAGITVPHNTQMLLVPIDKVRGEPLSREKMSPILSMLSADSFESGAQAALELVQNGGMGHTSCLYTDERRHDRISHFEKLMPTARILVDSPATFGAIGDVYNFRLEPAMSLGCGSWGGNSFSGNVGVHQLLNVKTMAERRENMLFFKVPKSIYFKRNIIGEAFKDLIGLQRCVLVTDSYMVESQAVVPVLNALHAIGIKVEVFHNVQPDPTFACVREGVLVCNEFKPDLIIGLGGGSPVDAAKVIRLLYEHPEMKIQDLYTRFMDIRKRVIRFPLLGSKVKTLVCIPSTSGTGAEVTPFAVIKDENTHVKYPLADYSLTPDIAIVDVNFADSMPRSLAANTGVDALTHAIESYTSVVASDFTRPLSLKAIDMLFTHLKPSVSNGPSDIVSREHVHHASTIAGLAFANAFLGICHSLAHALGSEFGIPHGLANALCLPHVIAFNAVDAPTKRAAFAQYKYYRAMEDYADIAIRLGLGNTNSSKQHLVLALINAIQQLNAEVGIPASVKAMGKISQEEFEAKIAHMSELAFDDQCTGANPRYPLIGELRQIYNNIYHGVVDVAHLK